MVCIRNVEAILAACSLYRMLIEDIPSLLLTLCATTSITKMPSYILLVTKALFTFIIGLSNIKSSIAFLCSYADKLLHANYKKLFQIVQN